MNQVKLTIDAYLTKGGGHSQSDREIEEGRW